ncbi:hypothetical protein EJB05_50572, partial [Eragrostis curvula]
RIFISSRLSPPRPPRRPRLDPHPISPPPPGSRRQEDLRPPFYADERTSAPKLATAGTLSAESAMAGSFTQVMSEDTDVDSLRTRTRKSSTLHESVGEEHMDGSAKSGTPDSPQPPTKKRATGRKQAKEKSKDVVGPFKEALQELVAFKKKELELEKERWRWTKEIEERRISIMKRRLQWEKEKEIMFCDVSKLEPDARTRVLAMRAQIAASAVAALNGANGGGGGGFGCHFGVGSGSFGSGDNFSQI